MYFVTLRVLPCGRRKEAGVLCSHMSQPLCCEHPLKGLGPKRMSLPHQLQRAVLSKVRQAEALGALLTVLLEKVQVPLGPLKAVCRLVTPSMGFQVPEIYGEVREELNKPAESPP